MITLGRTHRRVSERAERSVSRLKLVLPGCRAAVNLGPTETIVARAVKRSRDERTLRPPDCFVGCASSQ
ncbi:hypothetical protein BOSEA31B_12686 [Hyphomicrobiales bacterium]|nr:hypothetical protein BOSEA31B_12686 [Hyphomicrobiales bacterium]CAH1698454.1 hypothetical protein BOSEA1005_11507 [Hyphomicrobiales bacterium]CAI0342104.1 hypothetical protein BO1005MUT1_170060 [Hyphomicrobiales bacterium]